MPILYESLSPYSHGMVRIASLNSRVRRLAVVRSDTLTISVTSPVEYHLSITVDKTEGFVGDTFRFSGYLMMYDPAVGRSVPVTLTEVSLYIEGEEVGSDVTDSQGRYSIDWIPQEAGIYHAHTEAIV